LQVIGKMFDEELVVRVGDTLEKAASFNIRPSEGG
jgi:Asp-tRNA(Asn)/Glu-tRNA(Gln) amidotransferase A subunit family amidase